MELKAQTYANKLQTMIVKDLAKSLHDYGDAFSAAPVEAIEDWLNETVQEVE